MAKSLKVMIVTPESVAYEGEAQGVVIPGAAGYLGIWADHAPLVSAVVPGVTELKVNDAGLIRRLSVGEGFVEISDNVVNLMVETCEAPEDIDPERAAKALTRARERLQSMEKDLDRERARLAVSRAEARMKVLGNK